MEVILVRHANSEGNARISNDLNSKLTKLGKIQAKLTADYLYDYLGEDAYSWSIMTSPYKRTYRTASKISEKLSIGLEHEWGLREIIQEQGHYKESDFPYTINENQNYTVERMETNSELVVRLDWFAQRHAHRYIVVSHGLPIQILRLLYLEIEIDRDKDGLILPEWDKSFKNCSITHIKDGKLVLDRYTEHLTKHGVCI